MALAWRDRTPAAGRATWSLAREASSTILVPCWSPAWPPRPDCSDQHSMVPDRALSPQMSEAPREGNLHPQSALEPIIAKDTKYQGQAWAPINGVTTGCYSIYDGLRKACGRELQSSDLGLEI